MSNAFFLFNCQQATLLLERRADERLSAPTRVQLWAHLKLCPLCRRYEAQSRLLARQARPAAEAPVPDTLQLPAAARRRLQQLVDAHAGGPGSDNHA
ncbi:hypothetical protein [Hymenobacter sp. IS2118]|uniref:anti-sigma factor family protein n=1 Tax=Hymenobacter sp. IS2118 TaxID=1505605 RepID=UPI000551E908|nr:hypothetical protein [Hymenobacter sp. IS2118]